MLLVPQYRATVFAQRSVDPTETTVLTPAAGAPHSDPCKFASVQGVSGFKYLGGIPDGRRGAYNPLTKEVEHGTLFVPIGDHRVIEAGDNAERWFTAFTGAADGHVQLLGCKVQVEWRTDPAAAWADYWTGRVRDVATRGLIVVGLRLGDMSDDLEYEIGTGRPHPSATGLATPVLLPQGFSAPYGIIPAYNGKTVNGGRLRGTVKSKGPLRYIELDTQSQGRSDNILSSDLIRKSSKRFAAFGLAAGQGQFATGLRLRFASASPTISEKEVVPVRFTYFGVDDLPRVQTIQVTPTDPADPFYQAFDTTTVPDGTVVTFDVRDAQDPTTYATAQYVRHLADIADGYFGPLTSGGAVTRAIGRDSTSFTALLADTTIPTGRFPVKREKAKDYVEKVLLRPGLLAVRFNESGKVVVYPTSPPASLAGIPALTLDDLAKPVVDWKASAEDGITELLIQGYEEFPIPVQRVHGKPDQFPDLPPGLVEEDHADYFDPFFGESRDLKPKRHTIDARGLRFMAGELATNGVSREEAVRAEFARISEAYRPMYGRGAISYGFTARRTANTTGLYQGMWATLTTTYTPPNPATNRRGNTRLIQITSRSERGLDIEFEAIDAGPGVLAAAPTIGTPTKESGNGQYGFQSALTLNGAGDVATVWACYTGTGVGTRPADSDPGWHMVQPLANSGTVDHRVKSSATHTFRVNPPGKRVWVRTRSESAAAGGSARIPSPWAYPAGTGFVDLDPLASCSGVAVSGVTAKGAHVAWTVGDATLPVVLLLGSGASQAAADASTPIAFSPILPPGSNQFDLTGLDGLAGPWFRVQVAQVDAWGNPGPVAGTTPTSFQATGTAATAPTPGGLLVLRAGGGTSSPAPAGAQVLGAFGVELQLVPGPSGRGYDAKVFMAPDSSGSPGTYAQVGFVEGELMQGRARNWRIEGLPNDGLPRWFKFLLAGPGVQDGPYSPEVSAIPGWLTPRVYESEPGEAVLGEEVPFKVDAEDMMPQLETDTWSLSPTGNLDSHTTGSSRSYQATCRLPPGSEISRLEARGIRAAAGDITGVTLFEIVDDATLINIATITFPAAAGFQTQSVTGLSRTVRADRKYMVSVTLKATTIPTDSIFRWARIWVKPRTYKP